MNKGRGLSARQQEEAAESQQSPQLMPERSQKMLPNRQLSRLNKWKSEVDPKVLKALDEDAARAERQLEAMRKGEPPSPPPKKKKSFWGIARSYGWSVGKEMADLARAERAKWVEVIDGALNLQEEEEEEEEEEDLEEARLKIEAQLVAEAEEADKEMEEDRMAAAARAFAEAQRLMALQKEEEERRKAEAAVRAQQKMFRRKIERDLVEEAKAEDAAIEEALANVRSVAQPTNARMSGSPMASHRGLCSC